MDKMQTFVIYDKRTKDVVACVPGNLQNVILRNDVEIKVYNDTEPVFIETRSGIKLFENSFIIDTRWNK